MGRVVGGLCNKQGVTAFGKNHGTEIVFIITHHFTRRGFMQRSAKAKWQGSGKEGSGWLTTTSGALKDQPYSTKVRFQDEAGTTGTNPEELIAAAHAGCFSMALSFQLTASGHVPTELRTEAVLTMEQQGGGFSITGIHLKLEGNVPGISEAQFSELAAAAKANCPVSRALSVPITLECTLVS